MKMANEVNPKLVGTETEMPFDDLCVEEIRQLKIVRVKSIREGEDPSYSYHFSPSTRGLPDDFLCMDGITWKSCDEAIVSRAIRNWVHAWTSTTVVIGGDGKIRKPIFAEESTNA